MFSALGSPDQAHRRWGNNKRLAFQIGSECYISRRKVSEYVLRKKANGNWFAGGERSKQKEGEVTVREATPGHELHSGGGRRRLSASPRSKLASGPLTAPMCLGQLSASWQAICVPNLSHNQPIPIGWGKRPGMTFTHKAL